MLEIWATNWLLFLPGCFRWSLNAVSKYPLLHQHQTTLFSTHPLIVLSSSRFPLQVAISLFISTFNVAFSARPSLDLKHISFPKFALIACLPAVFPPLSRSLPHSDMSVAIVRISLPLRQSLSMGSCCIPACSLSTCCTRRIFCVFCPSLDW